MFLDVWKGDERSVIRSVVANCGLQWWDLYHSLRVFVFVIFGRRHWHKANTSLILLNLLNPEIVLIIKLSATAAYSSVRTTSIQMQDGVQCSVWTQFTLKPMATPTPSSVNVNLANGECTENCICISLFDIWCNHLMNCACKHQIHLLTKNHEKMTKNIVFDLPGNKITKSWLINGILSD